MKKKIKQFLSALLVAVMLVGIAPAGELAGLDLDWIGFSTKSSALEASGQCGENVYWTFDESTGLLTISGEGEMDNYSPYNEDTHSPFYLKHGINELTIESGVKSIGAFAFFGCGELTRISIPDSVKILGDCAFNGCSALTSITIPDGVTSIGEGVFYDTEYYNNLNNWENDVLYINNYLICAKKSITGVCTIKSGIEIIADYAFEYCTDLMDIIIPKSVTIIGESTFSDCTSLTNLYIPDSVTSIGWSAFNNCTGLTNIKLSNCITSIDRLTFHGCAELTSITIPDSVTGIGDDAFADCTGLTNIIIPNSVTSIKYEAFSGCNSLTDVYYTGSESEWNEISINDGNECLTNATIHYNYSGSHTHTLKHITVPSTCKIAGMEYDICEDCGETFNENTLPLAAHIWGEWTTVKKPTATAEGMEKRICSVCGREETRSIEKSNALVDENTGVEIIYDDEYDSDTEIKVEEKFSGKSFQLISSAYGEVNSKIYDIATYKDGVKVQPNGEITVRVPLPDGFRTDKVFVCYVDSVSGKVTKIPCEVKDGYVIFKTNHFSEYAVVEQAPSVKSVSIGDVSLNYKKSTTLKPTIKADDGAKYTVKYSSSNKKVATVDKNGKVYAAKRGSATITCTVTDSNGNTVTDTCKVTVDYSFGQWLIKILLFGWIWY